jgi:hypothetical protein
MKAYITAAAVGLLTPPMILASSNTVGTDPYEARLCCEDLADSYQIFPQERERYLARCISSYHDSPPGENGTDVSPHAASY